MSEAKAKYDPGETPIKREKQRFTWLHNRPGGYAAVRFCSDNCE